MPKKITDKERLDWLLQDRSLSMLSSDSMSNVWVDNRSQIDSAIRAEAKEKKR